MAHRMSWNVNITVPGGPTVSTSRSVTVEAYDAIDVSVRGTAAQGGAETDKEVQVQPGGAGQVTFLAITSDHYDANLTFTVNANSQAAGTTPIALDQPQTFVGAGAVSLLDPAPISLFFSNGIAETANIRILVGRDATP